MPPINITTKSQVSSSANETQDQNLLLTERQIKESDNRALNIVVTVQDNLNQEEEHDSKVAADDSEIESIL